jgi:hypothetical protein
MPAERACYGELTQLVADHIFSYKDRHMPPAVMHTYGVAEHFGHYGRRPRPGLDYLFFAFLIKRFNFFQQLGMTVRTLSR